MVRKQLSVVLILCVCLVACRDPRTASVMVSDANVALQFTKALTVRQYVQAYAMTAKEYQKRVSMEEMRTAFEAIVPPDWVVRGPAPMTDVMVVKTMADWPDKKPQDLAWVYVGIPGDAYSEGLVAILSNEGGTTKVRDVQWGRP
jgi:hypothetical protein